MDMNCRKRALLKMAEHAANCRFEGVGGLTPSFRLVQERRSKKAHHVNQIKCCGCGFSFSLDYESMNREVEEWLEE